MERLALFAGLASALGLAGLLFARAQWIERRTEPLRHPPHLSQEVVICSPSLRRLTVMIGDSRVSRWPTDLLPMSDLLVSGVAGETVSKMATRFADALASCPDTIVIASGINDLVAASLMNKREADEVVERTTRTLIALAERAAKLGSRVYLTTIIPPARPDLLRRLVWSGAVVDYVGRVNAELRAHPWQGTVLLLDFAAQLDPDHRGVLDARFRYDTLHLNRSGYVNLSNAFPTLRR